MAEIIRMPRLSDTMEEGVIVGWLKSVGDKVEPGDILAEVETDKATMELESFYEGFLLHIGVEEGAVPVDGILAVIGEKDEDYSAQLSAAETGGTASENGAPATEASTESSTTTEQPAPAVATATTPEPPVPEQVVPTGRVKASPLAKAMAAEAGLNIGDIAGTGDHGRVVKRDVEAAMNQPAPTLQRATVPEVQYGEVPVSQMRKTIARRLAESKFTAPHFYLTVAIDMSQAVADRTRLNDGADVRVSFNDLVIKACALALKQHPNVNSSWNETTIRVNESVNIGVAVAIDDGLLVPVIRNADQKGLRQIHEEVVEYAGRAQKKKLQVEEMQGNTFTISNLGMFGIDEFTAIINPPESCILAVGTITQTPVVRDDQVTTAHIMKVTMSCDHRVVDGASGAKFLQTVKEFLEAPVRMLG